MQQNITTNETKPHHQLLMTTPDQRITSMGSSRTAEFIERNARLWQSEAFNLWLGLIDKRMTTEAGTGSGKTRLAVMTMFEWLFRHGDDAVIVFGVPSKGLLMQTADTMRSWRFTYGRIGGGYNELILGKNVYISTYASINKVRDSNVIKGKKVLLILDECHKVGAEQTSKVMETFQGDACLMLSATPHRSDGADPMEIMNAPIRYTLSLMQGIKQSRGKDDALDFTFNVVYVQPNLQETMELEQLNNAVSIAYHKAFKFAAADVMAVESNLFHRRNASNMVEWETRQAIDNYKTQCMKRKRMENEIEQRYEVAQHILSNNLGKKYAAFHESIFGIERLNQMCRDIGYYPRVYHSGMTLSEDQALAYPELDNDTFRNRLKNYSKNSERELTRWTESPSDILLTCKSLKEGFDVPDMDGLIMMTGTNAVLSRIQTIGRVFRGRKHKEIWMLVVKGVGDNPSGDERCLNTILKKTEIPQSHVKYHYNLLNLSQSTQQQDTGVEQNV